jgi:hypothetical protein
VTQEDLLERRGSLTPIIQCAASRGSRWWRDRRGTGPSRNLAQCLEASGRPGINQRIRVGPMTEEDPVEAVAQLNVRNSVIFWLELFVTVAA